MTLQHKAQLEGLQAAIDKLQAFKDFVHKRLDDAGIPTHPDGPHSAAGCRIGDRLDIALMKLSVNDPLGLRGFSVPLHVQMIGRRSRFPPPIPWLPERVPGFGPWIVRREDEEMPQNTQHLNIQGLSRHMQQERLSPSVNETWPISFWNWRFSSPDSIHVIVAYCVEED
jgi:hypothetical protein